MLTSLSMSVIVMFGVYDRIHSFDLRKHKKWNAKNYSRKILGFFFTPMMIVVVFIVVFRVRVIILGLQ